MSYATIRSIMRWVHLIVVIPIFGYIFSPFALLPSYAPPTRFVFFPIMVLTGLFMWKGHWLWRVFGKSAQRVQAAE